MAEAERAVGLLLTPSKLRVWGRQWAKDAGFWSIVDQGTVSAGNFLTTILLARCLLPSEYGIYALLFALMLFMIFLDSAVIVYGLSLHGAVGTDAELRSLAGGSLVLAGGLALILGLATGAVAALFHRAFLAPWIFLALLFWQLQETTRRALMSRLRFREAVGGDALSYLGQTACIGFLFVGHRLTIASAFGAMAATSAAAALLQAFQLKLTLRDFRGAFHLLPRFWDTGRWAMLVGVAQAFIGQALLWFLAVRGTAEVASFQAILNLLRGTNPIMFAIGSVVLPTVASLQGNSEGGLSVARRYGVLGVVPLLPYFTVVFVFPRMVLRLLYGAASPYVGSETGLRVLVVGSALMYVVHVLTMYYFGLSRSDVVFRCELVAAATAVVGGFLLVTRQGVLGAAMAFDLIYVAEAVAFIWYLRCGSHAMVVRQE
jgi:O-antigen/teichoic acid export membrane protein